MDQTVKNLATAPAHLQHALKSESEQFERALYWLEQHMPPSFLEEVDPNTRMLVARNLLSFSLQDCFSQIHLHDMALVLCLDGPDADLRILQAFGHYAIRYYRAFVSNEAPPFVKKKSFLRIGLLVFNESVAEKPETDSPRMDEILQLIRSRNPEIGREEFEQLLSGLTPRFYRSMTKQRLSLALDLFFRAKTQDLCQYEVRYNQDWINDKDTLRSAAVEKFLPGPQGKDAPSLQLILAWRNVPKHRFLFRLAEVIHHHGLALQKVVATYIEPYSTENILLLSLGLHGLKGKAAWEETDIEDFLRELTLLKYFETDEALENAFVTNGLLRGNEAHLVQTFISLTHQALVHADPHLYSFENVKEGLLRHPELTVRLCQAFEAKFHPKKHDLPKHRELRDQFLTLIDHLDTGQPGTDQRRKNILRQTMNLIDHTLKTNFYVENKSAFGFRLSPGFLEKLPEGCKEKFPVLPYGIFFVRGMHFIGFHIRFKDLARGGVRTVMPERHEQFLTERSSIFSEAYNLAFTQQKKNKDIPEGGSKMVILLESFEFFAKEEAIYANALENCGLSRQELDKKLKEFRQSHKLAFLYSSQRSFIESFLTLINCDDAGALLDKAVVDYWKRPEYIYLGPDENMHNSMIEWIADTAVKNNYRPGRSFMSSKPLDGINHKEYGVTSFGVNVYLHQTLLSLGINPEKDPFTVKISGGPDGDVAGNEIFNLYRYYPKTARLVALIDVSGTIFDPLGLDLENMADLFRKELPIRHYPPQKLSEGGFLLDLETKKVESALAHQTLCWKKQGKKLEQTWLSGSEMNTLYTNTVPQTPCDVFIPAGGRPRTLNESNYHVYLDEKGQPKTKAIVEGANLYLTPGAREVLEKRGVMIIKDSSCNKGGVICSSFEVLAGLCLSKEEFLEIKREYVEEVLKIIGDMASNEARLLLSSYQKTHESPSMISDKISEKINLFKYQLLAYLDPLPLSQDPSHFLIRTLLDYCPALLRERYRDRILQMPDIHKKAIIACAIAAKLVYSRGIDWSPSVIDILPTLYTSDIKNREYDKEAP